MAEAVLSGLALALGLGEDWFPRHLTAEPTVLFRIFHYPPVAEGEPGWGVAEHTDYGLLTLLAQDHHGGLEVRTPQGWVDVPPVPGALVANIGDMLDRMTGGRYRSTPHRVRPSQGEGRLSLPYFYDPGLGRRGRPAAPRRRRPPTTTPTPAGTAPASATWRGPTGTTSRPRWPRSSRPWPASPVAGRRRARPGRQATVMVEICHPASLRAAVTLM